MLDNNQIKPTKSYINKAVFSQVALLAIVSVWGSVEFYLYPTVGTVLIHSVKPELTE